MQQSAHPQHPQSAIQYTFPMPGAKEMTLVGSRGNGMFSMPRFAVQHLPGVAAHAQRQVRSGEATQGKVIALADLGVENSPLHVALVNTEETSSTWACGTKEEMDTMLEIGIVPSTEAALEMQQ